MQQIASVRITLHHNNPKRLTNNILRMLILCQVALEFLALHLRVLEVLGIPCYLGVQYNSNNICMNTGIDIPKNITKFTIIDGIANNII